ncbi:MAG: cell division protein FtsZ [Cenarchaeum symbiont of Oopsacas minuta]|nr:cell division protein FtsZ [Cenarchaeum symbiont of Oopsacas minuta]
MECKLEGKILLIGIGNIGSKMASLASKSTGWNCVQIGTKRFCSDYDHIDISNYRVLNPSMRLLRASALNSIKMVTERIRKYDSVIIFAALGEKEGAALAPMVLHACKNMPTASFVTMPFAYEKERIFESGVALKRVMAESGFTSIVDNEAIHESNPDLSIVECHTIACDAVLYVLNSLGDYNVPGKTSIISSTRTGQNVEESLRDSLKMLYNSTSGRTGHSILYISGSNIPVGVIDAASKLLHDACGSSNIATDSTDGSVKMVMTSAVVGKTRFDLYDPLGTIPIDSTLDWDELECGLNVKLDIKQLE